MKKQLKGTNTIETSIKSKSNTATNFRLKTGASKDVELVEYDEINDLKIEEEDEVN